MNHSLAPRADQRACPFCAVDRSVILMENTMAFAVRDLNPVTPLHTLVLPRRHVAGYFELDLSEVVAIEELLRELWTDIAARDGNVEGFNVGINVGTAAGQTIPHCHVHLIPRRRGDVPDPWGGVRAVIPGKARYPT
jgi:ATP adenylyltransferase